jgi:prepilin-type N-terminal cleavage/methylation domain-containing protein/prepilin-type processing-associated H-X9-DG protein
MFGTRQNTDAPAPNRTLRHQAFTLVELLVVIVIIAVFVALVLPWIQVSHVSGRRSACSNNLRNLHLAIAQFETAKSSRPASRTFWNDAQYTSTNLPTTWTASGAPEQYLTWVHEILPYVEQRTIRDQVETTLLSAKPDVRLIAGKLGVVFCPSDDPDENLSPVTQLPYSQLSYAVNSGVTDNYSATSPAVTGFDWPQNGLFDNRLKGAAATEIQKIFYSTHHGIADGSSNTIQIAENSDLEEWNYAPYEYSVGIVWDENGAQWLNKYPIGLNPPNIKPDTFTNMAASGVNLVPFARPLSQHPTGFMVVFADGHTKFVSESIAYDVYSRLMTSDGARYMPAGVNDVPPSSTTLRMQQLQKTDLADGSY